MTATCEAATGKKHQIPFSLTLLVPPVFPGHDWDVLCGLGYAVTHLTVPEHLW